jgi:hypothetical protein
MWRVTPHNYYNPRGNAGSEGEGKDCRFRKKETGGFTFVKGTGVPDVKNTYMAVFTLKALGMLDEAAAVPVTFLSKRMLVFTIR